MAYGNNNKSKKTKLDTDTYCQRFGLKSDEPNRKMGRVAFVFEPQKSLRGDYNEFTIVMNLHLKDHNTGQMVQVEARYSPPDWEYKNGKEEEGTTFTQHHQAWRRYLGQQAYFSFVGLSFYGEDIPNTTEKKITIYPRSLAVLSVPLIGGEMLPIPFAAPAPAQEQLVVEEEPEPEYEAPAPRMKPSTAFGRPGTPAF